MRKLVSILLLSVAALAQGSLTGEQILDRYIEVTGGKEKYQKITSETSTSVMEVKSQGLRGRGTSYKNAAGDSYNSLELDGVGKVEEGYYRGIAWENSAINGPRIKTGEEKAFFARESVLAKEYHWRKVYSRADLAGEEAVNGVPCYKVIVTPKDGGRKETRFYEKASGLLLKNSIVMASPMGDIPAESYLTEYREFGGIKSPTNILTKLGPQEIQLSIANVSFNQTIPAAKFKPPSDVMELAKKQNSKK